jgi:hypothetical protein
MTRIEPNKVSIITGREGAFPMPVYVDEAKNPYGRMLMSHMLADTLPELHAMADIVGLKRAWFQGNASTAHYDLC